MRSKLLLALALLLLVLSATASAGTQRGIDPRAFVAHVANSSKEWTVLEPGAFDHKYYVPGVGTVREEAVSGPKEVNILVTVKRGHHATNA